MDPFVTPAPATVGAAAALGLALALPHAATDAAKSSIPRLSPYFDTSSSFHKNRRPMSRVLIPAPFHWRLEAQRGTPPLARMGFRSIKPRSHERNRGYGAALASGFDAAEGALIFMTDGDKQFEVTELAAFLPDLDDETDLVIGWRRRLRLQTLPTRRLEARDRSIARRDV